MNLRFIFDNQLSHAVSSLRDLDPHNDIIVMSEVVEECTHPKHHKKKLVFILSAMRHFAEELTAKGCRVDYTKLDDPLNTGTIASEIKRLAAHYHPDKIILSLPGDYRLLQAITKLQSEMVIPLEMREDDSFLTTQAEFAAWAKNRKDLRLEYFYRHLRQKYQILMHGDQPEGGKWNYDAENRKFPKHKLTIPRPYTSTPDAITTDVIALVGEKFADHFGDILPFSFAINREQALQCLDRFIDERLRCFGDYQDAMIENEPWLYHSHISFYLNNGLLHPLECIKRAEAAYYSGDVSINAAEGFIRQILGWREYVRGVYWLEMPEYKELNFLEAKRPLPNFYWTADTKMNCLKQCVKETKANAYAHHIQRLMVLGNFALIAGLHPDEVNEWFLIVYADAYEWVELPNVTGMILFADGGHLASKPYAASGAYIHKMSNYCETCHYKVTEKNGATACPFNYLYWDFLMRNHSKLKNNQRLSMIYATLGRMDESKRRLIQTDAQRFFIELE